VVLVAAGSLGSAEAQGERISCPESQCGGWIVRSEKNLLDDTQTVTLRLRSEEDGRYLILTCRSRVASFSIGWNTLVQRDSMGCPGCGTPYPYDVKEVTSRLGTSPAVTANWRVSDDVLQKATSYTGHTMTLVAQLLAVNRFVAEIIKGSSAVTGVWYVTGLNVAIRPLRAACS